MLRVDYTSVIGEIKYNGYCTELNSANCLWAEMKYQNNERTLVGFACDEKHLENMLKAGDIYQDVEKVYFHYSKLAEDSRLWKAIKLFTKYGIDIEIDHN